jgi:hypothetical protein
LPRELSDAFEAKFGVRPIEGYGATEMSPLVSANTPASRAMGDLAAGSREGTVGRPAPGVVAKVVDPETGAELEPGERGMLWLGGPSLMKGYLGRPEATAEVVRDGWYATGDIATIDEDGFITLVDRQSRFAKIAGEMVPHGMVEDALHALLGPDEGSARRIVVTSVPDPRRGEKLVVVHTPWDANPEALREGLAAAGSAEPVHPRAGCLRRGRRVAHRRRRQARPEGDQADRAGGDGTGGGVEGRDRPVAADPVVTGRTPARSHQRWSRSEAESAASASRSPAIRRSPRIAAYSVSISRVTSIATSRSWRPASVKRTRAARRSAGSWIRAT